MRLYDDIPEELRGFAEAFAQWTSTLEEFDLVPGAIFETCIIKSAIMAARHESIVTLRTNTDLVRARHLLQTETDQGRFPRGLSMMQGHRHSKGSTTTAGYLWEAQHDTELVAALLLVASLFPRLDSSRKHYPRENWPPMKVVRESQKSILHVIRDRLPEFESWPKLCTDVLPVRTEDYWYRVDDTYSLWRLLAEEHVRLYCCFRVLKIEFTE